MRVDEQLIRLAVDPNKDGARRQKMRQVDVVITVLIAASVVAILALLLVIAMD